MPIKKMQINNVLEYLEQYLFSHVQQDKSVRQYTI